jgi:hypothetical protein
MEEKRSKRLKKFRKIEIVVDKLYSLTLQCRVIVILAHSYKK